MKKKLKPTFADDGIFYIGYEDFLENYREVDICKRNVNAYTDLYLNVNEKDGCFGPTKSCLLGCGKYFCCCDGCRLGCREVHEGDDLRKRWWARSISYLIKDFRTYRSDRRVDLQVRVSEERSDELRERVYGTLKSNADPSFRT